MPVKKSRIIIIFLVFLVNVSLVLFFFNGHNYWILTIIDKLHLCIPGPSTLRAQSG